MINTVTKTIGETSYAVSQLGALQGREALRRLAAIAGPAIEGGETVFFGKLVASIQKDDLEYFCNLFAKSTILDGKVPLASTFDVHFAGNYGDMLEWLIFAMEVNFKSFLDGVLKRMAGALVAAAPAQ